ncbi:type VI secretion system-associated protein TagO [Vibrio sp. S9_S30]|uniref:type VI secretion system-associated protein VasI n=1 Tax=Vibrio sp. S9_S30 TaxID=2720226 RepID=UPI001680FAE5|nr:type VI secretion system-associated protein VasI [Vibrio sp. S9_S30]MBD1557016.1 type VI secretion system-associated protein TagO [Vibrio sp. S9_S30]
MSGNVLAQEVTETSLLKQAQSCRAISSKVDRLACFDGLFGTPIAEASATKALVRPEPWQRAVKSEARRADIQNGAEPQWIRNETIDGNGDKALWFTLSSTPRTDSTEDPVILMASCIKKISRLEIIFPDQQEGARADVSLGSARQRWTFDEQGMVLRSGRGLAAISILKPLVNQKQIHVRSNAKRIDGLVFETTNSKESFAELRELCRW